MKPDLTATPHAGLDMQHAMLAPQNAAVQIFAAVLLNTLHAK